MGRPTSVSSVRRLLLVVVLLCLVTVTAGPAAAQSQEAIRGYRVDIEIRADGSLRVTEVIDYDFGASERHGIFRDIPVRLRYDERYDRRYDLDVESVSDRYVEEDAGGGLRRLRIGDPDRTISGSRTYTIVYTVGGALNAFEDHDELYWNAIGADWDASVAEPVVTVRAPASITRVACFAGPTGSSLPCATATADGRAARFTVPTLQPREAFTVVVALPKGAVPEPVPTLEERWSLDRAFSRTPATVGGSVALLVAGLAAVARLVWRRGRDRRFRGSHVDHVFGNPTGTDEAVPLLADDAVPVQYEPPDRLRPGQIGTLVDERAHALDVTATIVDLAVRGHLRIEEIAKDGWFGKPDWRLVRLDPAGDDDLLAYERVLHDALFAGRDTVLLSDLKDTFASHLRAVQSALYDDAVARGWYSRRPDRVRIWWAVGGVVALVGAIGVTVLLAGATRAGLLGLPLVVVALTLLVAAHWMPSRTAKGTSVLIRTIGFRRFIEESERDRAQFAERANLFSEYLPYAIVFGATDRWARAFAGLDGELPATSWYAGSRPFTIGSFSSSMDGFTTTTAGTIASTPGGSGSSGFGGGGSSGGGGGGGGGGSW